VSNKLWMNLIPKAMLVFVHTQRASVQGVMNLMLSNLYLDKLPAFLPGHEADYFYIHTHLTHSPGPLTDLALQKWLLQPNSYDLSCCSYNSFFLFRLGRPPP
jgi:hypothetical protein